jgi:hypothetical protein
MPAKSCDLLLYSICTASCIQPAQNSSEAQFGSRCGTAFCAVRSQEPQSHNMGGLSCAIRRILDSAGSLPHRSHRGCNCGLPCFGRHNGGHGGNASDHGWRRAVQRSVIPAALLMGSVLWPVFYRSRTEPLTGSNQSGDQKKSSPAKKKEPEHRGFRRWLHPGAVGIC